MKTARGFFYGLYMDSELLKNLGYHPVDVQIAKIENYGIDFRGKVKIFPKPGSEVWGMIITLPEEDVKGMYSGENTKGYFPENMEAITIDGIKQKVICYNLPPDYKSELNKDYLQKLIDTGKKYKLPGEYLNKLSEILD